MKVIFCTGNQNKFDEVKDILSQNYNDIELEKFKIPNLPEIQGTSREIVMEKLIFAEKHLRSQNIPFDVLMVEDSALYMECFCKIGEELLIDENDNVYGLPGPYIKSFEEYIGNERLFSIAESFEEKAAIAQCSVGIFSSEEEKRQVFIGNERGLIVFPKGKNGFGWDSIFSPGYTPKTYAQMDKDEKNKKSVRTIALKKAFNYMLFRT